MTAAAIDLVEIFVRIVNDHRYAIGITYGKPRQGHSEGTVKAHIEELDQNLAKARPFISKEDFWKLEILIHVHDTFKYWAKRDSAIEDPESHASLARKFLAEFTDDQEMLDMVQYHDESFALSRQFEQKRKYNVERLKVLIARIKTLDLFLIFTVIDTYTAGKMHDAKWRIRWFYDEVRKYSDMDPVRVDAVMEEFGL